MKTVLIDADGVTLKKQKEFFSERFAREYGAPPDELQNFFKNEFRLCQVNKSDLKEELGKRLSVWGWDKGVDAYLAWWFENDAQPDEMVLAEVKRLREQGVVCCLATDQEKYRGQYIRERLGFKDLFDRCFFSYELGYSKEEPKFFTTVLQQLNTTPAETIFWDDDEKNVAVAKSVGIDARFYKSLADLKL